MKIDQQLLSLAGEKGTQSATKAFSVLAGKEVVVDEAQAQVLPLTRLVDAIKEQEGHNVIAYTQLLTGVSGAAFLIVQREDALKLVDILLSKNVGETKVLNELDQDAVKETLNILSNSYTTALAQSLGITINVSLPALITPQRIAEVIDFVGREDGEEIITFEAKLSLKDVEVKINLYLLFGVGLAELINKGDSR